MLPKQLWCSILDQLLWHNTGEPPERDDFHETCNAVSFIVLVNSHQRWKQTRFRVCFHLWYELTSTMNVTEWQVSWNSCYNVSSSPYIMYNSKQITRAILTYYELLDIKTCNVIYIPPWQTDRKYIPPPRQKSKEQLLGTFTECYMNSDVLKILP